MLDKFRAKKKNTSDIGDGKRVYAIGDIHGCFRALTTLADYIELAPDDRLIVLGDYVDRGPDSRAVLDWLIHLSRIHDLKPLCGNHDIMMLNARHGESEYRTWIEVGGDATLREQAEDVGIVPPWLREKRVSDASDD